jgi:hypothetical protein
MEEQLDLLLGTQFQGIEEALKYAQAMERVARAESKAADSVAKAAQAQKELNLTRGDMPVGLPSGAAPLRDLPPAPKEETTPKEPKQAPLPFGPHQRLLKAGEDFDKARESGTTAQIADAHYALRRAQDRVEQAQRGAMSPAAQALYSTRINLPGGAAPLLGKGLEAVMGKEKALALVETFGEKLLPMVSRSGPIGLLATASYAAAKGAFELAQSAAKATSAYTSAQASIGGSVSDVARVQMVGDAGAARSFAERISSDPTAMATAAQIGVRQTKIPYGDTDFTKGYLQAIERTSQIADASQRRRLALILGIEQEVATWSLLSEATHKRMKDAARITGMVNDPAAQKQAAEMKASQDALAQAKENLASATGQLFQGPATEFLNDTAQVLLWLAKVMKQGRDWIQPLAGALISGFPGMAPVGAALIGNAAQNRGQTPEVSVLSDNTQALVENTIAMQKLNQNIGAGSRGRDATERLRTLGSSTNFSRQAQQDFSMGALG